MPFLLTTAVFFIWGMSNNLTDILVQQFRKSFELNLVQAQLVQTAVFLAYAAMAIPAAVLMRRFGYKAGLLVGLIVFGIGTLLFWPAAILGQYLPFLIALFVVGSGSSILETAANPLIARFGAPATSEQRLNFAQAFNPPGTITGVLIGTWFIFSGVEKTPLEIAAMKAQGVYSSYLHSEISRVVPTYVALGAGVLLLAALIGIARFPAILDSTELGTFSDRLAYSPRRNSFERLIHNPRLMSAVIAQFFYVGAQVSTWSTFIPYMKAYTAVTDKTAGYFLTGTLVALAIGRIVSTALMRFINPERMMGIYAIVNVALLVFGIARPGMSGSCTILMTSFFMSVMYPTIFALGVRDLGEDTKLGSSFLVISIIGGAIFPPLTGAIARATGDIALGYILPLAGYIVVAVYAFLAPYIGRGLRAGNS
ncbi:L-fucose:H+ symporter permease [Acidisarcina polymorpha]|uniref:L-fucose:H+ symporter permease n=1 Tax=Acidisarcina polymorpha TaxID=2211140 RepID=UPI001F02F987|nr:L-fucose:H+ symporter permease [Acidisarcina polymorpha]